MSLKSILFGTSTRGKEEFIPAKHPQKMDAFIAQGGLEGVDPNELAPEQVQARVTERQIKADMNFHYGESGRTGIAITPIVHKGGLFSHFLNTRNKQAIQELASYLED